MYPKTAPFVVLYLDDKFKNLEPVKCFKVILIEGRYKTYQV